MRPLRTSASSAAAEPDSRPTPGPRVSIPMVAYNHEAFLAEAIQSVLEQSFDSWQLIIGEDCSTDGTLAIARKYAAEHPQKIRLLETPKNMGAKANFLRTLDACTGTYISHLDGDDFWTDPEKLSLQVDYLDNHPDCGMVFCASEDMVEGATSERQVIRPPGRKDRYTQEDLIWRNCVGASCSVLWRKLELRDIPSWFGEVPVGDWILHLLASDRGWIGYIDRVMCVHRSHEMGVWTGLSKVARIQQRFDTRRFFRIHLGDDYLQTAQAADLYDRFLIANCYAKQGDHERAADAYLQCYRDRMVSRKPHPLRSLWGWTRSRLRGASGW